MEFAKENREYFKQVVKNAKALGAARYDAGFQSSPDVPPGTWLEPDVTEVVRRVAREGGHTPDATARSW